MTNQANQIVQSGKEVADAMIKSFSVLASGYHEVGQHIVTHACQSVMAGLDAGKEALNLKSPHDWKEFQSKWTGSFLSTVAAQAVSFSKLSVEIAGRLYEPYLNISHRRDSGD